MLTLECCSSEGNNQIKITKPRKSLKFLFSTRTFDIKGTKLTDTIIEYSSQTGEMQD
jgi:hypothetical protein